MVTLTSSSSTPNRSFDFMMNNNNSNNLCGPFSSSSTSFSYLTSKEDALAQKNLMSGTSININPEEHHDVVGLSKKASEDMEISVFGAEKYFNGDMDSDHSPKLVSPLPDPEVSIEKIVVGPKQSSKNSSETPSLRSESSWNSQSLLLQNKFEKKKKKKNHNNSSSWNSYLQEKNISSSHTVSNKKSFLANLGCRCVCSNWNSVDVVDEKTRTSGLKKIKTQLSFSENLSSEMKLHQQQQEAILEQRRSLEIFGSPLIEKRIISKKFPWEYSSSSAKTEERGFAVKYEEEEDGSVSDLSSDLFEIESVTGKAKPFLARQGSSDPESPNCYAPSEVSIAWSVVTASVADYSVMSECATSPVKNRSFQIPRIPMIAKSNRETGPQRQKSSSGGLLLGCKSHKSVRVSGDSYTSVNRTPSYVPRFPVEANPTSIETRRKISTSSVSRTQSPFLYIQ